MPRKTHATTKVRWLPTVANKSAPTVAEINAGTDLTPQLPVDGVGHDNTRNRASQAMLGSSFISEEPGTWGTSSTLTFTRDPATASTGAGDPVFTLFTTRQSGFLLISRHGAPVAGSVVEVYPSRSDFPEPQATAENEYDKFAVQFATTAEPVYNAVVAA